MEKETIAGYEVRGKLGEGGMGIVYRAWDTTLDRPLAIKVIRPESMGPEAKDRFLREARACSRINHPHIVTVYAAGEEDGDLYLAMELLEGKTLRDIIDEGPIPWEQAVNWIIDILGALERLHTEGIVHRDLKPENVMVDESGSVTLMDFGIAHIAATETITVDGSMLGTASYMSPEQVLGKRADARSDIFSLGCVLYQMLTGEPPFQGEHPMAVMYAISNDAPKPIPEEIARELPDELKATLDRALEKDPQARFENAVAFRDALLEITSEEEAPEAPVKTGLHIKIIAPVVLAIAIIAMIIVVMLVRRESIGDREEAFLYNERGQDCESENKYIDAEIEYRKAIAADPSWDRPYVNLSALWMGQNRLTEAESLLHVALSRDASSYHAYYNLGSLQLHNKNDEDAERSFRAAISADTTRVEAHSNLGFVLIELGRMKEAIEILDEGLARERRHPSDSSVRGYLLKNRGLAAFELGNEEEALTYWSKALEIIPENTELNRFLASWYERHGDTEKAIEHWIVVSRSEQTIEREEAERHLEELRKP